jgi:hypothetical protein
MLKVTFVRDGQNQITADTTAGFGTGHTVVRDRDGRILGHSNDRFGNTRDRQSTLVSRNNSDPGLLIRRK